MLHAHLKHLNSALCITGISVQKHALLGYIELSLTFILANIYI